jgi:signal peptidase I
MRRLILLAAITLLVGGGVFYLVNPFGSPNWNAMSRLLGWQILRIQSYAMEPTIPRNSTVKICYPVTEFEVGNIVMFRYRTSSESRIGDLVLRPAGIDIVDIKRVAAIGPAELQVTLSGVEINGNSIGSFFAPGPAGVGLVGRFEVPAGMVFLMGDNLAQSNDSRANGPIPMQDVIGKACDAP